MYAQHQRLRDTMMSSPYQHAANSSPSAPPSRRQGSSVGDWNVSSPAYRDLGVVSSTLCVVHHTRVMCCQVLTDDSGVSTLAA
jgi:hypothetical protein